MIRPIPLLTLILLLQLAYSLPRKSLCTTTTDCDAPLSCLGTPSEKRCFEKKPVGMRCALDPFWVCQDSLICQDRVCKIPVAGACNNPGDVCADGLDCLGNPGKKRCEMKKGPGMRCGVDPFWVCQDGLTCVDSVCRNTKTVSESCNDPDDVCADGLDCLGNPGKKRCEMKKGPGMRCGVDPFWVCQDGLTCVDSVCHNRRTVADSCNDPDDVCEDGLDCLGNPGKKRCEMKKGLGMRCGQDPFWVCADGLVCTSGRCASTTIPVAGACNNAGDVCEEGLSCLGYEGNKKCFMKKQKGMRCGQDPFWVCDDKLACVNEICKKVVGRGKRCGNRRVCKDKFVCAGERKQTKCVRPGKVGKACGEFDTCRDSTCVDGICVA